MAIATGVATTPAIGLCSKLSFLFFIWLICVWGNSHFHILENTGVGLLYEPQVATDEPFYKVANMEQLISNMGHARSAFIDVINNWTAKGSSRDTSVEVLLESFKHAEKFIKFMINDDNHKMLRGAVYNTDHIIHIKGSLFLSTEDL